ncbi:hypothetical protein, partial [Klebsiella pneumoniae]
AEQNEGLAYTTRVNCAETTITLCADTIGALNAFYVKYQSLESLIHHVSMCLSCRDSKIRDVTH